MKKTAILFLTLLVLFTLCGCDKNKLCGKWYSPQEGNTVIFDEKDGFTLNFWDGDSVKGTFIISETDEIDGILHYTLTLRDGEGRKQDTDVKIDGGEMTLANTIYKKQ